MSKVAQATTTAAPLPNGPAVYKTIAPAGGPGADSQDDCALANVAARALTVCSKAAHLLHLYSGHTRVPTTVDAELQLLHAQQDRLWPKAWNLRPATAAGQHALAMLILLHTPTDGEVNISEGVVPEVCLGQWLALSIIDAEAVERVLDVRDGRLKGSAIRATLPDPLAVDPATQAPHEVDDDPAPGRLPEPSADLRTREAIIAAMAANEPVLQAAPARHRLL